MIFAVYSRKSTEQEGQTEEGLSTTRQRQHGKVFGEKKEWTFLPDGDWVDEAITGTKRGLKERFKEGAGLYNLMEAVKQKRFQKLVIMDIDRLIRDMTQGMQMMDDLHEAGIEVWEYLHDRMVPMATPTDRLMVCIRLFSGEQETYQTSLRTKDGLKRQGELGYATGPAPYGFKNVPHPTGDGKHRRANSTREEVPEEVAALRRLATLFADDHLSPRKTAHVLNVKGLIAPQPRQRCAACRKIKGKECEHKIRRWSGPTVRSLLLRPCYREIFGERLWQRIQKRFTEPIPNNPTRRPPSRRGLGWSANGEARHLLTGLLICPDCGGNYIALKTSQNGWAYRCGTYHKRGTDVCRNGFTLPKVALERAVLDSLDQTVLANQIIDQIVNELWKAEEAPKPKADLRKELATVEQELAHYAQAIAQAGPLESLLAEIKTREDRKAQLQDDLKRQQTKTQKPDKAKIKSTIVNWRKTTQARIALQTILKTPLVISHRKEDGKIVGAEFRAEGNLAPIIGTTGVQSRS